MCEVTWNTWESVIVVLMPVGMKASCIEAPLSFVCFLLLSGSPWLFFFLFQMISHCIGSNLRLHSFTCHPIFMVHAHSVSLWLPRHLQSLPLPHHLSDHFTVPTARHLQLPWCRGWIPCALPLRTLAPWPRTSLPHQQSMICAQHRLRLTMQLVHGHSGNLGDECADHTTALGTLGLTSRHNVVTHWIRNNFDASVCFDGCNNISEFLERLQHLRTDATLLPQNSS